VDEDRFIFAIDFFTPLPYAFSLSRGCRQSDPTERRPTMPAESGIGDMSAGVGETETGQWTLAGAKPPNSFR